MAAIAGGAPANQPASQPTDLVQEVYSCGQKVTVHGEPGLALHLTGGCQTWGDAPGQRQNCGRCQDAANALQAVQGRIKAAAVWAIPKARQRLRRSLQHQQLHIACKHGMGGQAWPEKVSRDGRHDRCKRAACQPDMWAGAWCGASPEGEHRLRISAATAVVPGRPCPRRAGTTNRDAALAGNTGGAALGQALLYSCSALTSSCSKAAQERVNEGCRV